MKSFRRTPAYRAAINQLADAIAAMPIEELAPFSVTREVADDLENTLEQRHPSFGDALAEASVACHRQRLAERRKAVARKAGL